MTFIAAGPAQGQSGRKLKLQKFFFTGETL
jgi:hypothetical protein